MGYNFKSFKSQPTTNASFNDACKSLDYCLLISAATEYATYDEHVDVHVHVFMLQIQTGVKEHPTENGLWSKICEVYVDFLQHIILCKYWCCTVVLWCYTIDNVLSRPMYAIAAHVLSFKTSTIAYKHNDHNDVEQLHEHYFRGWMYVKIILLFLFQSVAGLYLV